MSAENKHFDALLHLFQPVVEASVSRHLETRLQEPITVEQIDGWAKMLKGSGAGRWSKWFGAKRLKQHRKQVLAGKTVKLSARERKVLMEKALKHVPRVIVRDWLGHLEEYAKTSGMILNLSEFDDTMRPYNAKPQKLDARFASFGVRLSHISEVLLLVRRSIAPKRLPDEARQILEARGVRFE